MLEAMANIWLKIFKPKGIYAKWLIFLILFATFAMGMLGHFQTIRDYLDTEALTFTVGDYSISAYNALQAMIGIVLIFWVAAIFLDFAEKRISKIRKIRAANRALVLKMIQILTYIIAFLLSLNVIGVDLTALAVFSGALGIGVGFGLQKISSNFISGLILLFEKAIEEGHMIELADGTTGFVRKAHARYTLIETLDGKEILVPNEDFIINRVTNWTFTNSKARVEIPIGVSYSADIEKARDLILEAAKEHPRCMSEPEPHCFLRNFGDNSVNFILHFWVADVIEGRWAPQSDVMFSIWKKFKKHKIDIPFPQRDLHIKTLDTIKISNNG
jgi:small-conductance mechanosensitive channel